MNTIGRLFWPIFIWGMVFTFKLSAQSVYISRFVPGNYLADNLHQIELKNPSSNPVNIGGWMLVTRDYSLRFPANTTIQAGQVLRVGKENSAENPIDFSLSKAPEFLIRLHSKKVEGNYAALFDKQKKMLDGFYHSQLREVPFLPEADSLVINLNTAIMFKVPPENNPLWGYFQVGDDPAIGFEKANNVWRVTSSRRMVNVYPATSFKDLTTRYVDDAVTLKWFTAYEEHVKTIDIERSIDQIHFETIGSVAGQGTVKTFTPYTFYDSKVKPKQIYYYRLKQVDEPGNVIYSRLTEAFTEKIPIEFWLEAFPLNAEKAEQISIRFYSAYSQRIKIKIIDANMREVAMLYSNLVYADTHNLLRLSESLPVGTYTLIATTDSKRYFQKIIIGND